MARIAGIIRRRQPLRPEALRRVVNAMRSGAASVEAFVGCESAVLGATAPREGSVFSNDRIFVVTDGAFHVDGSPTADRASEDAAARVAESYLEQGFDRIVAGTSGDFAIALYDLAREELWLARDRLGVKPLYYVDQPAFFAFASRPGGLLALDGVSPDVNRRFVAMFAGSHYRYFDNAPDESPYAAIAQLPPAHIAHVSASGLRLFRYWTLDDQPDLSLPEAELAERYRELLVDAVRGRLAGIDRPAFTLSGGMDSSSVLASAVHVSGHKHHAFSTVYADPTYDESAEIRSILADTVDEWHQIRVDTPNVPDLVERMIAAHDEPVATATWLSHFVLCEQAAAGGFTSLFGGLGGDELNAGEYEYFPYFFADLNRAGDRARLSREIEMWVRYHDHPVFRKSPAVAAEALQRTVDPAIPGRCLPDRQRLERYAAAVRPDYFDIRSFEPAMDHPFASYLKNRTYQDLTRETIPCCLRAEDRNAERFGLEVVLPFFDHRLVEFMYRIPGTLKIRDGVTKHLLREAMRGVLPETTRLRVKKTGWNAPAHLWFTGPGREMLLDLIGSASFRERNLYDVKEVRRIIDEHDATVRGGRAEDNHMMFLWQLLNLEVWQLSVERRSSVRVSA